ncbi:hypothetical protein [Haloferula rosea]|uniref:Uncharacterized protein n=1 Tax=Haloferula rosea TaxID=490093 RepID=A0A934VFD2_9BACT|nr:hypothetical protein [Haloferula rosea]MBK1828244.1 hypothetical protein [Haloferula rosea]
MDAKPEGKVTAVGSDQELDGIEDRIRKLRADLDELGQEGVTLATRYQNAGAWAIHYSNVRLAVATFSVTACIGIIALSEGSLDTWKAAGITMIAVFGWIVFAWASHQNCRMLIRQRQIAGAGKTLEKYFSQVEGETLDSKSLPKTMLVGRRGTVMTGDIPFKVVSVITTLAVIGVWATQCPVMFDR